MFLFKFLTLYVYNYNVEIGEIMQSVSELYRIGCGPSSSHTMGPESAAKYMLEHYCEANRFVVILFGSLALTGKGHLTDEILYRTLGRERTRVEFDFRTKVLHPNTLIIEAYENERLLQSKKFISVGGGEVIEESHEIVKKDVYPFKNFSEIRAYCEKEKISLAQFVFRFEDPTIRSYLNLVYDTMEMAIKRGLNATGTLPGMLQVERKARYLKEGKKDENREIAHMRIVSSFAYAVSEENASGGQIVTAPTCGSCGVLPATLFYLKERDRLTKDQMIEALAVASVFGNVIKSNAAISGAFAGCQSEIGSACSMAAAAAAFLQRLPIDGIEYAAEIAMEHHLGLTCDPINGLVQIPCIERNAVAALRALDAASLASFLMSSRKISFDTVVETMYETGKDLNQNYKETSMGGLAKTYRCQRK